MVNRTVYKYTSRLKTMNGIPTGTALYPFVQRQEIEMRLTMPGPDNDFLFRHDIRFTNDANGDLKAAIDNYDLMCGD